MSTYTLVIEGDCPAINADTTVTLSVDRIQYFAGKVVGVMFDDALMKLEDAEEAITELKEARE